MLRRIVLFGAICGLLLGAASAFALAPGSSPGMSPPTGKQAITVRGSSYGRILFDRLGFALYAFTKDPRKKSTCYGACAKAWPPYLVRSRPVAGRGTKASLIGTVRRANGKLQATYAGRPLYFYVGDRNPGQILCQNVREFGGLWLVVRPSGALVR
jgi:predicted lipoprotein with Yx(FWY)xxD motif